MFNNSCVPDLDSHHWTLKVNLLLLLPKNAADSVIMPQQVTNELTKPPGIWLCCQPAIENSQIKYQL